VTRRLNTSEARENFGKVVDRVSKKGERVVLSRRGKELAAIIPLEDLHAYERFLEEQEDRQDIEAAREALKEPGEIPLDEYLP